MNCKIVTHGEPGDHRRAKREYAGRGRSGLVIDHALHIEYDGPSFLVGWESPGGGLRSTSAL